MIRYITIVVELKEDTHESLAEADIHDELKDAVRSSLADLGVIFKHADPVIDVMLAFGGEVTDVQPLS